MRTFFTSFLFFFGFFYFLFSRGYTNGLLNCFVCLLDSFPSFNISKSLVSSSTTKRICKNDIKHCRLCFGGHFGCLVQMLRWFFDQTSTFWFQCKFDHDECFLLVFCFCSFKSSTFSFNHLLSLIGSLIFAVFNE